MDPTIELNGWHGNPYGRQALPLHGLDHETYRRGFVPAALPEAEAI